MQHPRMSSRTRQAGHALGEGTGWEQGGGVPGPQPPAGNPGVPGQQSKRTTPIRTLPADAATPRGAPEPGKPGTPWGRDRRGWGPGDHAPTLHSRCSGAPGTPAAPGPGGGAAVPSGATPHPERGSGPADPPAAAWLPPGAPGTPAAPGPGGSAVSLLPMECSDPGLVALLRPALYTTL